MLAALIDTPKEVTEEQMERWALDFNSWDLCDHCCYNLFDKTPFAYKKINEWSTRKEESVKRAAFTLIAALSVHDKKADDQTFEQFFPIIEKQCSDERTYVKKAVSWALRGIGKRNKHLTEQAIPLAKAIHQLDSSSAKYIAAETFRELQSEKIPQIIKKKTN
jgi:3-methyladenine DNA glycosylase AlkD